MINTFLILLGKFIAQMSKLLNRGSGSTWPGHIALALQNDFIKQILQGNSHLKIILVIGTNGKTTTSTMIATILSADGKRIMQNTSGANLLNGVASSFLLSADMQGKITADYAIFEVDENSLPLVVHELTPHVIVALNLFRDQLDRYGELDTIAKKWQASCKKLDSTMFVLNADDPLIAWVGLDGGSKNVYYFGLPEAAMKQKTLQHGADSIYCPRCGEKLVYKKVAYSHLGEWKCPACGLERPKISSKYQVVSSKYPLEGVYNIYNARAAITLAKVLGVSEDIIKKGLETITPVFGRQEKIEKDGKTIQIFLSKNPTSFNESLATITELEKNRHSGKRGNERIQNLSNEERSWTSQDDKRVNVLFVLNDRIPDGRDISWIWDIDLEQYLPGFKHIIVSGDRTYDMALRLEYAQEISNIKYQISNQFQVFENLNNAIKSGLESIEKGETLYILPTYSAMLEVREILTGRGIL